MSNRKMMLSTFVLLMAAAPALSDPTPVTTNWDKCGAQIAAITGDTSRFSHVGHAIHSITVRDIRRLFDKDATAENYIPVINMDLTSDHGVLSHAQDIRGDDEQKFDTDEMRSIDAVLSHMNEKMWDIKFYTPLERVVHVFHMNEVWTRAKAFYDKLEAKPVSDQICSCAMDVAANDVLKYLRVAAMAIREPGLVYGTYGISYSYSFFLKMQNATSQTNGMPSDLDQFVREGREAQPRLEDKNSWKQWKAIMLAMTESDDYNTAVFLHCAVRKAKLQRKKNMHE